MFRVLAILTLGIPLAMTPPIAGPDDIPDDLARWIETDPPAKGSDRWSAANQSDHEWAVTLSDGRLRVLPHDPKSRFTAPLPFSFSGGMANDGLAGRRLSTQVADGWVVGFDAGEFGGGLWWFSPDGKDRRKLVDAHVKAFLPTDPGLLAVEGLAHMSLDRGRILRLARDDKGLWKAEDFLDLKAAPEVAIQLDDGKLLVATSTRLLKIDPATKAAEVLLDQAFWGGLYPNSMASTPAGVIYLGMRQGVAKVEKLGKSYRMRWLLPNEV